MTDQQVLERRVRETLVTRADGVAATPALYERVQRGIRRDRRWGLAGAWAILATIVALAGLVIVALPDEVGVDVVDEPSDTTLDNGDGSTEDADDGGDTEVPRDLPFGGVGYAMQDDDGPALFAPDGSSLLEVPGPGGRALDLAVPAGWTSDDGVLVVLIESADGGRELHTHRMGDDGISRVETRIAGSPDGDRIAVLADGSAVVWVEDLDLVVMPIAPGRGTSPRATSLDLPPNGPASLVAQQVVTSDDGGLRLLATDPDARQAWWIPLEPGDVPGMYDPDFVLAPLPGLGAVLDVLALPDGSMLALQEPTGGADVPVLLRSTFGPPSEGQVQPLPNLLWPNDGGFELDSGGGWQVTVADGQRGQVHRYLIDPDAAGEVQLAISRGADTAVAGVHVGSTAEVWDLGSGDAASDWRDELSELQEQELRQQLAQAHAEADVLRARIAALEEQREQASTADEVEAIEEQLDDLRSQLQRQVLVMRAQEMELVERRLEESRQPPRLNPSGDPSTTDGTS